MTKKPLLQVMCEKCLGRVLMRIEQYSVYDVPYEWIADEQGYIIGAKIFEKSMTQKIFDLNFEKSS